MPNLSDLNKSHIDIIRDELSKVSFITKDNIEYQTEKGYNELGQLGIGTADSGVHADFVYTGINVDY